MNFLAKVQCKLLQVTPEHPTCLLQVMLGVAEVKCHMGHEGDAGRIGIRVHVFGVFGKIRNLQFGWDAGQGDADRCVVFSDAVAALGGAGG